MRDPYFGHRDWYTGEPLRDRDEWTDWDFALIAALQVVEDNMDKHGLLSWEVLHEDMDVNALKKIDKFQAAVARRTKGSKKKGYTPSDGEYFVPELSFLGPEEEYPTYRTYLEGLRKEAEEDAVQ